MKRHFPFAFPALGAAVVLVAAVALMRQRWERLRLHAEIAQAQREVAALDQLRAENAALRAKQIPVAEFERLRSDHAALPRLRAEVEMLQKRAPAAAR
jgi:hypothetical protein